MKDLYQEVTDRIIASLEAGALPWLKPWKAGKGTASGLPFNAASNRAYSGVNTLLLMMAGADAGYSSDAWMTYKQAQERGGQVRKGEHGQRVVLWKMRAVKDRDEKADEGTGRMIPLIRAYTVFNLDQIDGIEPPAIEAPEAGPEGLARAEAYIAATGAQIRHGGDRAYYTTGGDFIQLPHLAQFTDLASYYATALHELTHWTGADHRLARKYGRRFGDESYAAEELVAEMGAAFQCARLGIEGEVRHAGYIDSWLRVLKADNRAIFTAARAASAAADYLADFSRETITEDDEREAA